MNPINAKSVQLIELHAFAYCLLSVSLSESFDGTEDRQHYYAKFPISDVIEFLSKFKFQNVPDSARKQATLRYLKYLNPKARRPVDHAYLIFMARRGEARERAFKVETQKLQELFSGRSTTGSSVYPGDRQIRFEDSITIQIHKVKLKCESTQWCGKEAYTLAIYYPDDFAINYVES